MVACQLPKLNARVRFPLPAPKSRTSGGCFDFGAHGQRPGRQALSHLIVEFVEVVAFVQAGAEVRAVGDERLGRGAVAGFEHHHHRGALPVAVTERTGGLNRNVRLLEESAHLLLDILTGFAAFLEETYPGEQHMHLSVTKMWSARSGLPSPAMSSAELRSSLRRCGSTGHHAPQQLFPGARNR